MQDEKKMKKAKSIATRNILMVNKSERLVSIDISVKQCVYCLSFVSNYCGIKTTWYENTVFEDWGEFDVAFFNYYQLVRENKTVSKSLHRSPIVVHFSVLESDGTLDWMYK